VHIRALDTGKHLKRVAEDHVGSIYVSGRREQDWFFLTLSGFLNPGVVSRYTFSKDGGEGELKTWRETKVQGLASSEGLISDQVHER
jgi:prolyl oligopeptidase